MLSPAMKPDLPGARLRFDRFELDEAEARLTCAGEPVALAPKPFAVLCALARAPRTLVTKNALLDAVWGHRFVTESVLKSAISEVRSALGDDPKQPRYIETVSRRGYRFIAAAAGAPAQSAAAVEQNGAGGPGHPALAGLAALCRSDAALAGLIHALAATLEREPLVLN
jgi:DNA-binding winged helix-turn-helix (wHTH) protein